MGTLLPVQGWIWVSMPWATVGVRVVDGVVVDAAPIVRWAVGKPWPVVQAWFRRKGAVTVGL
jgi:hypothetical protein